MRSLAPMRVLSVVGNRPQFVKSAPLSVALRERGIDEVVLHTGQHYDRELSEVFFDELGCRARVPARPAHGRRSTRCGRASRTRSRGAAGLGARLRRHELDARRRPRRRRGAASRSRTSRPGCGAATSRCPRSATGSRSTGSPPCCSPGRALARDARARGRRRPDRGRRRRDGRRDQTLAPIARARSRILPSSS